MAANRLTQRDDLTVILINPRPSFVERMRLHQLDVRIVAAGDSVAPSDLPFPDEQAALRPDPWALSGWSASPGLNPKRCSPSAERACDVFGRIAGTSAGDTETARGTRGSVTFVFEW
jgi:hypothetical protein